MSNLPSEPEFEQAYKGMSTPRETHVYRVATELELT